MIVFNFFYFFFLHVAELLLFSSLRAFPIRAGHVDAVAVIGNNDVLVVVAAARSIRRRRRRRRRRFK